VAFGYEASEELRALLEDFREMVNFAIERALEANVTGYARLRKMIYDEWKRRWNTSMRLMSKYSKRERNRVKDRCHKIAKSIMSFAKANG